MFWFTALAGSATLVLAAMLTVAAYNARHFPRLGVPGSAPAADLPPISVLVPARNEAAHIAGIVAALRRQNYPEFELIVLDDHSTDGTGDLARAAAAGDPRVSVVGGAALPPGWLGKNWACHQLAQQARFDHLLFTDADVLWRPGALRAVVDHALGQEADLLTVWPTQITVTWAERLVVPMMSFILLGYLPVGLAHEPRATTAVAANGQCLLFTRRAYERCGGHASICHSPVDDISLAYQIKRVRLNLRMADGSDLVACRMYHDIPSVINGYAKVLLAAPSGSLPLLLAGTLLHLGLFVAPWPAALGALHMHLWPMAAWMVGLGLAGLAIRLVTAATARLRRGDALLLPVSVLFSAYIALYAAWTQLRHGGPVWKGRRIILQQESTREPS